jgi:hypothetical protein
MLKKLDCMDVRNSMGPIGRALGGFGFNSSMHYREMSFFSLLSN